MNSSQNKVLTRKWKLSPTKILLPSEFQAIVKLAMGQAKTGRTARRKPRDLAVLVLAGSQGLRVSEIQALTIGDLERLAEGIIRVRTLKQRRPTVDESLCDEGVQAALRRYLKTLPGDLPPEAPLFPGRSPTRPMSRRGLALIWTVYAKAAGTTKSIHSGRHLAATQAVHHAGIKVAQAKLRHASLASTLAYVDIDFEEQRRLLEDCRVV